jgi:hypothetical protein
LKQARYEEHYIFKSIVTYIFNNYKNVSGDYWRQYYSLMNDKMLNGLFDHCIILLENYDGGSFTRRRIKEIINQVHLLKKSFNQIKSVDKENDQSICQKEDCLVYAMKKYFIDMDDDTIRQTLKKIVIQTRNLIQPVRMDKPIFCTGCFNMISPSFNIDIYKDHHMDTYFCNKSCQQNVYEAMWEMNVTM